MVGGKCFDGAVADTILNGLSIIIVAERRTHFEICVIETDVINGQCEVVRGCFGRYFESMTTG